ncbi:MAG: hypothetical protein AB8B65_01405 [Kordia sp.]|uniref:hypothetical protein n=1 Tax=Kordia sp. TaxID=1965332 RepID=UPI00385A10C1
MKKLQIVLIALLTSSLFISCQKTKGVSNADDMGRYAFDILKNLDNLSSDEFINTLCTAEEIKAFGKRNAETLDPKAKKGIDDIKKESHEERVGRDYDRLKKGAEKNKISWSAIEYDSYDFEERDQDGIKFVQGKLSIKHKDETYIVGINYALMEGTYMLIRASRLNKKPE